ncbi:MAG: HAMP domain-containing sensor histidine kinase [Neisseria sp.]|nr:HAMP domain-containing sensor histidine kinase [Neisseria sp.]
MSTPRFLMPPASQQAGVFRLLYRARFVVAALLFALCAGAPLMGETVVLPLLPLLQIALFLLLVNAVAIFLQRRNVSLLLLIECTLLADVLALSEMLVFTGGTSNPLTFLYLLPVLTAALSCPPRFAWGLAFLTSAAYFVLFFVHRPFPVFTEEPEHLLRIHLIGMWLTFLLSAGLITGWVSWLSQSVRERELRLTAAYKRQQENEYWLHLGVEAANMAHQLSTPLNNLILLCDELQQDDTVADVAAADLSVMNEQLQTCKEILWQLKHPAPEAARPLLLYSELAARLAQWHNLRGDTRCVWHRHADDAADYRVWLDASFWSAFLNILNNAADAADGEIDLYTHMLHDGTWEVGIHNRHGYLSEEQLSKAGLDMLESEKPAGLGLGVRLSHATLSQLSGSLTLDNHPAGGVYARIRLPLRHAGENHA